MEREDHQDILERLLGEKSERREEQSVQSAGQVRKNVKTSKRLFCFLAADVVGDSERRKILSIVPFLLVFITEAGQSPQHHGFFWKERTAITRDRAS